MTNRLNLAPFGTDHVLWLLAREVGRIREGVSDKLGVLLKTVVCPYFHSDAGKTAGGVHSIIAADV